MGFDICLSKTEGFDEIIPLKTNPAEDGIFDIPIVHHSLAQT